MVSLAELQPPLGINDYHTTQAINVYDGPNLVNLSTQVSSGRYLRFGPNLPHADPEALQIRLREDDYPGWIAGTDLPYIEPAPTPYTPISIPAEEIQARIPAVIAFAKNTLTVPNTYLWGGTLGPNYDCSGLMQRAYGSQGIWLPRDSYQQHAFVESIANPGTTPTDLLAVLQPGDLIFFGSPDKTDHVALYLGNAEYIHSSGQERGRNQIAIDSLDQSDTVRRTYYQRYRGAGRVVRSYCPPG